MNINTTRAILAVLAFLGLAGCIAGLYLTELPAGARDILLVTVGALIALSKESYGYFFGSSAGSQRKDELYLGGRNETIAIDASTGSSV